MDLGHLLETVHGSDDHDGVVVISWVSVCPKGLWKVQQTHKGSQQTVSNSGEDASCPSSYCPSLGSLCQVRVQLKANVDETESLVSEKGNELSVQPDQSVAEVTEATAYPRCQDSVLQVPLGAWTTLRLGEGQCDVTEACVKGMRVGEKCEMNFVPPCFRLPSLVHLGSLYSKVISGGWALSKILAYDWINHFSVIFIDVLLQPLTSKPTLDADESDAGKIKTDPETFSGVLLKKKWLDHLKSFSYGTIPDECVKIQISPVGPDVSVLHPAEEILPLCATVELKAFTPGKESWEMPPGEKWQWLKSHKERGGVRFRSGDVWGAADSYSRALKLLITLYIHVRDVEKKGQEQEAEEQRDTNTGDKTQQLPSAKEFKTIKAELHSNLSLCQLKLNQPERAKASAAKATQLEPDGAKAWYRVGQACQMLNELEEARQAFRKLLELQPESPAALKALKDIASREKERNAEMGLRLSKMFS